MGAELPIRAESRCAYMATAPLVTTRRGTVPANTDRSCVFTITITAPQQVHRMGARALNHAAARSEVQQQSQQSDQALTVGMQKAKVAGAPDTFGQHMLQHQPQEMCPGNAPTFHPCGLGVSINKAHLSVVAGNDIHPPNDALVNMASQIDERFVAGAEGFTVHNPLLHYLSGQTHKSTLRPADVL